MLIAVPLLDRLEGKLIPIGMDRFRSSPPLGVYWLASILRDAGHEINILDLIALGRIDEQHIQKRAGEAELVGISCNSLNWPTARVVINHIKSAHPALPVVLGGIHPGMYPEHVLNSTSADFVIRGEGEVSLLKLVEALEGKCRFRSVPGLVFRQEGGIVVQPNLGLISIDSIERLPDPAYDFLPNQVYESLSVESARGCKFNCTFCSTKHRGNWRSISAENFVDRLERLSPYLEHTRYKVFSFVDDLYTFDVDRVCEITRLIRERGLDIHATLDARATDIIRGNVVEALLPITNHMLIGAECGYNEGLKRIAKGSTIGVLERAAAMLQEAGISHKAVFSFVIGFPFETREDCTKTIEFASNLLVKYNVRIYLQWFNTIPGSILWDELAVEGCVDIGMYDDFGFFTNKHLFRAGVRLSLDDIYEISSTIKSINTLLLFTQPANDIIQFSPPECLFHEATLNFPSHGVIENGVPPEPSPPIIE
ncbi:hypothetical protein ES703_63506 [subsurface metagenome]